MYKRSGLENRWSILLCLVVLAIVTALIAGPRFWPQTAGSKQKGLFQRNSSVEEGIPQDYDIRIEKSEELLQTVSKYRSANQKDAVAVADIRDEFVRGEQQLKQRFPNAKVEYNTDIRIPEVISPDVQKRTIQWLTGRNKSANRPDILRGFIKQYNSLVGMDAGQIDSLDVTADYTNPDGNLSFVHLEQRINGVPVFRGEVKAGFTARGEMIRVINNLAPGLDYSKVPTEFGDPSNAVRFAAAHIKYQLGTDQFAPNEKNSTDLKAVFGSGDWATTAEKMYFPLEPGVAVPAWRVLMWKNPAYYVIVDANTGTVLWHKNITDDQTQNATYQVYNSASSYFLAADSPAPLSPGPTGPINTQAALGTRTNVTLIGNEAPNTFNNNGWITDGANVTDGNAVEAGVDRTTPDGVDATVTGVSRTFSSTWNPAPGSPPPGDDPLTTEAQRGAVIQMFYVMNRYHDVMYRLGFTEAARNFQATNFTGQGTGNDRVSAEGQDNTVGSSCPSQPCTNNANFSTPADGGRGKMQMYVWSGPTPDYDGTADAEVIIHEHTHGLSNRLHGNASGLSTNMSRGMGEGWGDFYGYSLLAESADPINGVYTTGGYATFQLGGMTSNYYHGIRRFPRAPITFTGGPNNLPHNPFTFKHVNSNCDTTLGTTSTAVSSAFPRNPVISTSSASQACDQVHNLGEVWSSALWEVRNRMVSRLGFDAGTTRVLQVVTDGMKLAPVGPTFLQERDAIIAAAAALALAPSASADVSDVREGFRVRGMGFSASIQNAGTGANNTAVTEAFDAPNAIITNPISVGDSTGDNDGYPEPGENVLVSVPITNSSGATINNVVGNITGGGSANYGNIADGATVTRQIAYTVPAGSTCGSQHTVNITGTSASGALNPQTFTFTLGVPVGGAPVTVTGGAIANPGTGTTGVAAPYPSTVNVAGLSGNKKIILELTNLNTTYPGDMDWMLVGPGGQKYVFMSDAVASFTTQVNSVVVIRDDAAASMPATAATNLNGTWKPTNHGTGDTFAAPAPAGPYLEAAPAGAATFASVFGTDGANMNGTWSLYGVDDVSGDIATIAGWKLTFEANDYACAVTAADVEVSGRVLATADGRGLRGARVVLRDESGNETSVFTGAYGTFRFPAVETGHTYILSVVSRRFQYAPQVLAINDNVTDLVLSPQ
ncbi:MAG TPA: M36 family metallopeptidase [Pyrinomonadaceae bacterium]|nr:M36 family metallopeptidase [Pyrinomonadaceae bacterium]